MSSTAAPDPFPVNRSVSDVERPVEPLGFSLTAVVNDFPAPSQTFIRRKLDALARAGVDVSVMAANFPAEAHRTGHRLIDATPWRHPGLVRRAAGRSELAATARALTAEPPRPSAWRSPDTWKKRLLHAPLLATDTDIVHFEFSGLAVTYIEALEQLAERSRLVVSCRGAAEQIEPLKNPARGQQLARVFSMVDLIHCVSEDIATTAVSLGAPPDKILINRPAVPVSDFAPLRRTGDGERTAGPFTVLSVGRLHWKKGLDDGLRAIAALRRRGVDVRYRIAGGGDQHEKLSFMVDQLGLTSHVTLLGTASQAEVRSELDGCDALLLPSLSEGISNAALEAMASGRPVVTTDCGGMSEVIDDGVDGFVVDIGDTAAMADRLHQLAQDPATADRIGTAAAARADRDLDIGRQRDVFLDAYQALLA